MMSDDDKAQIKAFVDNTAMFDAVRRVLLSGMLGEDFASKNWVFAIDKKLSDSAYGKQVKVSARALEFIDAAFSDMRRVASSNPQPEQVNEAR